MKNKILVISTCDPEKTGILLGFYSPFVQKNTQNSPAWNSAKGRPRSSACGGIRARSASHCFFDKGLIFDIIAKKIWRAETYQSEELLPVIDKLLRKHKIKTQNLGLIIVNVGPGSFTGTRVGVATANALGFSLNIPVISVKNKERIDDILKVGFKLFKEGKIKKGTSVNPYYDKKPNITNPRKNVI